MKKKFKIPLWVFFSIIMVLAISYACMMLRESKTPHEISPKDGNFIKTRDADVFVRQIGPEDGKAILLIHGTGAWGAIWEDTEKVLVANGFRVITIDVPPFGYSEKLAGAESYSTDKQAKRILDVLEALNLKSLFVLCHSVGCRPTTEAVLQNPSIFKKLIQVDAALGFSPDQANVRFQQNNPSWLQKILMSSGKVRDSIIAAYGSNPWSIKPIFESFVFKKEAVTNGRLFTLKKPLVLEGMTRAQGDWLKNLTINEDNAQYTNYNNYKNITIPVLLLWGDKDELTPLWQGRALQKLYKNAELAIIPNAGHIPYLEDTSRFNHSLMTFLSHETSNSGTD